MEPHVPGAEAGTVAVRAQRLAQATGPLTVALFRESNPIPVKYALALFGLMSRSACRWVELSAQHRYEVAGVLWRLCDAYSEYMIGNTLERSEEARAVAG
jgi:dihydrodipicolinate synthase/N-acetylneuraminate lyase